MDNMAAANAVTIASFPGT